MNKHARISVSQSQCLSLFSSRCCSRLFDRVCRPRIYCGIENLCINSHHLGQGLVTSKKPLASETLHELLALQPKRFPLSQDITSSSFTSSRASPGHMDGRQDFRGRVRVAPFRHFFTTEVGLQSCSRCRVRFARGFPCKVSSLQSMPR